LQSCWRCSSAGWLISLWSPSAVSSACRRPTDR
jgi:hypothetical protein